MKLVLATLLLFTGFSAFAHGGHDADVTCTPRLFGCTAAFCGWQNGVATPTDTIRLLQDRNYPNANYPFEVWRGTYLANFDGHALTLDLMYTDRDKRNPITVNALLSTPNVAAESSGTKSVNVALRNSNYGRGFSCTIK